MLEKLTITPLAQTVYKKCDCCGRVRDVFFKLNVYDSKTARMLVGDFSLCKTCGENFSEILNINVSTEHVVSEFTFTKT
ncbi:MAG TPA: hypothetical protein VFF20_10385 [Pseudogracilibacillus sp.]|nr:hypothetical protein [Pseudogracilibacillus sp.]